jgi:membrane fusion protein, multidrug efflux system
LNRAKARLDNARTELEAQKRQRAVLDSQELVLRADIGVKRAALALARTNLDYTRIVAPEDGIVGERKVRAGQLVSPGTQVISLVEQREWVQANYREDQLRYIRPGDPAEIRVDAFPGIVWEGKVEEISPASGSQFALLPPDNATGNFTKVAQRVPVKIVLADQANESDRLRPGLSVVAAIRTKQGKGR